MAVGPHHDELALIQRENLRLVEGDEAHGNHALFRSVEEGRGVARIGAEAEKPKRGTEQVERRAAVGEPRVRCAAAGTMGSSVGARVPSGSQIGESS